MSDLVENPEERFSHDATQIMSLDLHSSSGCCGGGTMGAVRLLMIGFLL